jgi:hypothetical protein
MKRIVLLCALLLFGAGICAQEKEIGTEKLVNWMRAVNTLQFGFKMANHKYANGEELLAFAKTAKPTGLVAKELTPSAMAPYTLQVTTSTDGAHYLATILRLSDMHDKATWCKTAAFSSDSGLIYLGQNIGCSGVANLGASSKPSS